MIECCVAGVGESLVLVCAGGEGIAACGGEGESADVASVFEAVSVAEGVVAVLEVSEDGT